MNMKYQEIKTTKELNSFRKYLQEQHITQIAVDFEAEFNLHVYGEKLCLIQVFDGEKFYLIDPFKIDPQEIKLFLEMKSPMKFFFGADSDRSLVYKQYGIKIATLFDVQHLVDVLELPKKGLDSVLISQMDVEVVKKKKFQRYNWTRRPIEEEAKQYALGDVEHLFELSRILIEKIKKYDKVAELAYRMATIHMDYDKKSIPGVFKIPAFKKMNLKQKARFTKIVEIREAHAKRLNLPPNTLLTKQDLTELAYDPQSIRITRFQRQLKESDIQALTKDILKEFPS